MGINKSLKRGVNALTINSGLNIVIPQPFISAGVFGHPAPGYATFPPGGVVNGGLPMRPHKMDSFKKGSNTSHGETQEP